MIQVRTIVGKNKKISAKYSRVKGINLSKNFGQHNA